MGDAIHAGAPLDYASIQIFPNQNRYEACVCKGKQFEKVAAGLLEHLSPHVTEISDLCAKGFDANFDLKLPKNLHGAEWFSKATVKRFLHVVSSPDLINVINTILDEMSKLEDSKKFHASLYGKDRQGHLESEERDGNSSLHSDAPTTKPEVNIMTSDASKNELLRAMDLRLTALNNKLAGTFNEATGAKCSLKDMAYLANFCQHFGATNIEQSLCKFIKLNQKSQDVDPLNNETTSLASDVSHVTHDDAKRAVKNLQTSKSSHSDTPVKYSVSPAKAAQVERNYSTESEESSDSSDRDQTSAERSRSLTRSITPRRSASPMRRVQIGKAGPRRAAALTIKSLNYFPGRERPISYNDTSENGCEGEVSEQPHKKSEIDVKRITVQAAISLFESKQRDQSTDIQKRKSLADVSVSTNKSVLRRWSSGMGETSVQGEPENVPEDPDPVTSNDVHAEHPQNSEVGMGSDFISESHKNNEITDLDIKPEGQENIGSISVDNQDETDPKVREDIAKKLAASAEWNQRKQAEFNQILKKMVESKPVLFGKSQPSKNKNISFEQRGGSYDNYKEKRDAKLRGEKAGKRVEKETQFREMQELLDKRKAEMLSKNVSANKKSSPRLPQKSLRSSPQPANSPKETPKPSVTKKVQARSSSMPATRKSWSATPSPRAAGISPANARGGVSSASSTPTRRKPVPTSSVPQPSPQKEKSQKEKSQPRSRNEKEIQASKVRSLKTMNEKQQPIAPSKSKAVKAKVTKAPGETVPSKTSLVNKGTKKSSVVPLESKPFLRKGSRVVNVTGDLNKKKSPLKLDESQRESEDLIEDQESGLVVNTSDLVSQHSDGDTKMPCHQNAAAEPGPQNQINNDMVYGESENSAQGAIDGNVFTDVEESSLKLNVRNEEESTISPSAWVETEEDLEPPKPCDDSTFQSASLANTAPEGSASPRVRHSLSQMLQEECSEPDISEWGNAENPPAMIYQKDAPKGLKRLLKFARKNKGDTGSTGWSSPSVFSEGEDDAEELKNSNRRNADNLLRKAALNVKSYGQPKSSVHEGYESSANSDDGKGYQRTQGGRDSSTGPAPRASRSFFSLSAFRGSKPSESKFQ
ncbi:uncharacterized protein LOC130749152 isoform X2 [Lotus japonicus]|uniref:uncharacterized protein LOC130749152 isoform X2 n=1 Tax=Lotus japonicus TaxID=34305 RepID=UPI00259125AD|nr:uncharacterized protein LOC130749152 isoform X2 [Lotus japonicus]